jgi:uncharacterized protein
MTDIYCTSFPPQIMIRTDGVVELMKNSIFYSKPTSSPNAKDILLLTGDSQPSNPESQYVLAEQVLDITAKFNTKEVFTLGASITGVFVDKPRVFATSTDAETVKTFDKLNILTMNTGWVAGMNGLIVGIAKLRKMKGTCLLGETSGYVVDAKASKAVLENLLPIIGIEIDMTSLDKKAKDTEMLIQTIQQQAAGGGRALESQQPGMPGSNIPYNTGYIS